MKRRHNSNQALSPDSATADHVFPRPRRVRYVAGVCPTAAARTPHVVLSQSRHGEQSYSLKIRPGGAMILAGGPTGARYGRATLKQLLETGCKTIRCMDIDDWPDFAARGVMLDISRDKVPTMASLRRLVDLFAALKLNQLQLYTEHTFAYRGHERVWRGASPLTGRQIEVLDRYCRTRGIELVPNQNSFGHMERWLKHEPYRALAETNGPWKTPWGTVRMDPTTLNPLDPQSLRLMCDLYDQLLPQFSSKLFNVGCDETFELGQGKSAEACRRRGVGRVYLDYLLELHREVKRRGKRMMFWSDIIHEHPELISHLPRDVIPMVWGYEADHPFGRQCAALKHCGFEFYVCPGTSSWCSFSGRTTNAMGNLLSAARAGRRHGASGYLITDWGDYGHRQYLPTSYCGFLCGAAVSWCTETNALIDVGREVSQHVFGDESSSLGPLWYEAGRVHETSGVSMKNRTVLFEIMQRSLVESSKTRGLTRRRVEAIRHQVERLFRKLRTAEAHRFRRTTSRAIDNRSLALAELSATLAVLRHACRRAAFSISGPTGRRRGKVLNQLAAEMRHIISQHRKLWSARNRRGGLRSSLSYYERNLCDYTDSRQR